jgi:nucleoside-diphosphate-sugar epimerase
MRVFVTGATGFVGSAIVRELIGAGHAVLGLARSDRGAKSLSAAGAQVHRGSLEEPATLERGAAHAEAVIHCAFIHDFTRFKENCEIDRRAIGALARTLVGSTRRLIVTSGTALLAPGRLASEADRPPADSPVPRVATDQAAEAALAEGVHVQLVRLPPTTHEQADGGFLPVLIGVAREKGVSAYVGEGRNRWPAVHRLDAARLYRLALEKGSSGARHHAVAEEGVPLRDTATAIGRYLGVPVVSISPEAAGGHFGWFAHFAALDAPASSSTTRELLGWQPQHAGILADLAGAPAPR